MVRAASTNCCRLASSASNLLTASIKAGSGPLFFFLLLTASSVAVTSACLAAARSARAVRVAASLRLRAAMALDVRCSSSASIRMAFTSSSSGSICGSGGIPGASRWVTSAGRGATPPSTWPLADHSQIISSTIDIFVRKPDSSASSAFAAALASSLASAGDGMRPPLCVQLEEVLRCSLTTAHLGSPHEARGVVRKGLS